MQRRGEFTFPGSPARGLLPPRPPPAANTTAALRYGEDDEVRWLQASRQASPDYSSGTPSPQLWALHPNHDHLHIRPYPASAGSSPSRAQAIAGYRREMLDLVRGLPESAYELSLRDIVEYPPASSLSSSQPPTPPPPLPETANAARNDEPAAGAGKDDAAAAGAEVEEGKKQSGSGGKKQGRKQRAMRKQRSRSMERSVSLDTGLLIKLFLPLSIGGKKKVSPRPDAGKDGKKKNKDKEKKKQGKQPEAAATQEEEEEWWSKGEFSEAGGSSRTSSTGSSSNSSATGSVRNGLVNGGGGNPRAPPARSWSRKRTGCYAFFRANKSKNGVGQD